MKVCSWTKRDPVASQRHSHGCLDDRRWGEDGRSHARRSNESLTHSRSRKNADTLFPCKPLEPTASPPELPSVLGDFVVGQGPGTAEWTGHARRFQPSRPGELVSACAAQRVQEAARLDGGGGPHRGATSQGVGRSTDRRRSASGGAASRRWCGTPTSGNRVALTDHFSTLSLYRPRTATCGLVGTESAPPRPLAVVPSRRSTSSPSTTTSTSPDPGPADDLPGHPAARAEHALRLTRQQASEDRYYRARVSRTICAAPTRSSRPSCAGAW